MQFCFSQVVHLVLISTNNNLFTLIDVPLSSQKDADFNGYLRKLDSEVHLVSPDTDDPQLFVVIDKEVLLETDSYQKGLFALFGVHYAFNIQYPKKLKYIFQFIEEYVFGIPPQKRTLQYRKGVSTLLG